MLNAIIAFSLNNRLTVLILSLLLTLTGIYIANRIEVDVFPDLNAPTVVIMTEANGMAAEEVERLVTFPIETSVNGATDVRRVRSSSTAGFSVVWVEFEWETDVFKARQIVSEKMLSISEQLPENVGKPTLGPQSSILGEILILGLSSDSLNSLDLRTYADWTVRPRLLALGGVAQITVLGGDIKEYQILLNPQKMKHFQISLKEIDEALENFNQNFSGGVINQYASEYLISGEISVDNPEELGKSLVAVRNGQSILLEHIAQIQIGPKLPKMGTASVNGKPGVLMTVTKQPNTSTLDLTELLDKEITLLQRNAPADISFNTHAFRQSRFIVNSIDNVKSSLYEGCLFVVIVLFFFLMNARTTLISLLAIPISLLSTLIILKILGLSINTMSLGGMAIAIGSLVDDAIVDVENVFRHLKIHFLKPKEDRSPLIQVIFEASKEVRMPILNSTLIIVASFLPLFFLTGMEGKMLAPLGISFIISLFASTLVALTLTPVLCSYLLNNPKRVSINQNESETRVTLFLKKHYEKSLDFILLRKNWVLGISFVALIGTIIIFLGLGRSFLPAFNEGSFTVNVATMPGTSLEESDKIGRIAEEIMLSVPEVITTARKTGRAELDEHALGVNVSEIEAPFEIGIRNRTEIIQDLRSKLESLPGVNIEIGQPISHRIDAMLSGTKANIAIKIFGNDLNKLFQIGNQIKSQVQDIPGVVDLNVEQQVERPQLSIRPKREMLARYGITLPEFKHYLATYLGGEIISQVYEEGKTFDLSLKSDYGFQDEISKISELPIITSQGSVPLHNIAEIRSTLGPNTINRENVQRLIVVSANTANRDLNSVVLDLQKTIQENIDLPEDYFIQYGGQFESEQKASQTLLTVSLFSILIIFMLLYNQFKSTRQSFIILLNLPMALIGGVLVISMGSGIISIPATIGFISLFGIATRNGLLLVDRYNTLILEGHQVDDAIKIGSLDRLTPILMMAISTALALLPLALRSDEPGNEIQSPMAQVILGGLLSSTLLNMIIIPIVYKKYAALKKTNHDEKFTI